MAKGSVRKKGKKWYYRFYVEDASGKMDTPEPKVKVRRKSFSARHWKTTKIRSLLQRQIILP